MARTFINQSTQIGNSELYSDSLETGSRLQFSGSETVQDDLNALRTMVKAVSGEANWYLAPTASLFGLSGSLDSEISRASSAESSLNTVISTEVSRATSAEASLESSLSTEVSRATSAEASLGSDISTETSRATSAEASLESNISTEVSRATSAEASLESDISTETSRASSAEESLASNLSSEVVRATSVEAVLSSSISSEVARAISAETSLDNRIDTVSGSLSFVISNIDPAALDSLTEIVTAFQSADENLNGAITSLATALSASISTEVSRAQSVETVLSSSISTEVSRATSAEASLGTLVSAETSRATSAEASLGTALSSEISTELSRATSAEASLESALSAEVSRATSAEASLQTNIDGKVSKSGDTMTGTLIFSGSGESAVLDPTELAVSNEAAGTNLEAGFISLFVSGTAAMPTAPEHVTTKQYVDGLVSGLDSRSSKTFSVINTAVSASVDLVNPTNLGTALPSMAGDLVNDYDVFLNGMMLRPGVGNDFVTGSVANSIQLSFPASAGDLLCVVVYN